VGRFAAQEAAFFSQPSKQAWYPFLKSLGDTGRPTDELMGNILGLAVGASANYAQAAVHVVDFYLDDALAKERAEIVRLIGVGDEKSTELLRGYVREAMRMFFQVPASRLEFLILWFLGLKPQVTGLWREAVVDCVVEQGHELPPLDVKVGDRLFNSLKNAHLNVCFVFLPDSYIDFNFVS